MDLSGKLSLNTTDLAALLDKMTDFEVRLQKATSVSPIEGTDLPILSRDFAQFKALVWKALSNIKAQTELLALGLDRHETFLRRKTLLIHGVAETKEEKLYEVVNKLVTHKMQVELTTNDLQTCQRLGPAAETRKKPRAILVRFRDLDSRRAAWDAKTLLKGTGITISEFLTKTRHKVFTEARQRFGIRNCWSADGRIIVLLPDKTRRRIESEAELLELIRLYPTGQDKIVSSDSSFSNTPRPEALKTKGKTTSSKQVKKSTTVPPVPTTDRLRRQK